MPRARASHSRVEYVPEFGRAVRIAEFDRPMRSDDEETAQTVSYMDELAASDCNDPAVIAATAEALDQAGIDGNADPLHKAQAVYWWLKRTVRYVPTPGTSPLVDQTLIPPSTLLAMPEPIGDCPQFSMLAAAMFRVLCMDSNFVTIAAERLFPDQWSHIYNTVEVGPGQWLPFDSSNGPAPGAEYAQPFKRRVWPRLTAGKCRTKEGSADMLRSTYRAAPATGMRNRLTRRAVLGELDDEGNYIPDSTPPDLIPPGTYANGYTDPLPPVSGPSGGTPWYSTLMNDVTGFSTAILRAQQPQQSPKFITSPSGQSVLFNPGTGQIVPGAPTISSAINPTYLVIGVALVAAFAFAGKK